MDNTEKRESPAAAEIRTQTLAGVGELGFGMWRALFRCRSVRAVRQAMRVRPGDPGWPTGLACLHKGHARPGHLRDAGDQGYFPGVDDDRQQAGHRLPSHCDRLLTLNDMTRALWYKALCGGGHCLGNRRSAGTAAPF